MALAAVLSVKSSAISSATKDLRKMGEKILSELFGCRIKPKGTPLIDVWKKAPKFFYIYGQGVPGSATFVPEKQNLGAVFDIQTGYWYRTTQEIDAVFPIGERKKVEATLRKVCENVTGGTEYYIEVKTGGRGFVKLKDNLLYDSNAYNTKGGDASNPVELNVERKRIPGETDTDGVTTEQKQRSMLAGINPLALVAIALPFILKKS